jgi:hypothetical protein
VSLTKVSPSLFATSNNITSVTVGGSANTISLTFDGSGVITSATNNAVSVANTAITGNIISSQITSVANTQITGNIISSQISPSVTLTTPIISGNLNLDSAGTTGIRVPSANTLTFHTAGTEDVRIDSSGNVGIGTASPTLKFQVSTKGGMSSDGIFQWGDALTGNDRGFLTWDTGIGYVGAPNNLGFSAGGSERMRITSSGNFGIGTTTGLNSKVTLYSNCNELTAMEIRDTGTTGGYLVAFYNSSSNLAGGIIHNGTTTVNYSTSSDYRMKENIAPMTSALSKVALLKPVTYKWKEVFGGEDGQGFIAHELQAVIPDAVTGKKDAVDADGNPKYQGIDTSYLVATLTAAIQELKAINDSQATSIATLTATTTSQSATITTLSSTITALTARVVALES